MASISGYGSKGHGHLFTLTCTEGGTDIGSNTSSVHVVFQLSGAPEWSWSHTGVSWSVSVNGSGWSGSIGSYGSGFTGNPLTLLDTWLTIGHNGDGTKAYGFSFSVSDNSGASYCCGSASASGSANLTTIPRAATIDSFTVNGDLYGTFKVGYTKKTTAFQYWLRVSIPNVKRIMYFDYETSGATFSLDSSAVSYVDSNYPNSASVTLGVVIETWNGGTKVGESSELTKTVSVGTSPGISSVSISEYFSDIASKFGFFVQYRSKAKVSISASATHGASIRSYSTSFNGATYSQSGFVSGYLNSSGSIGYTVKVTDTRGRTATKTGSISVAKYNYPTCSCEAYRANSGYTRDDDAGTYALIRYTFNIYSLSNKNDRSVEIAYQKDGGSWTVLLSRDDTYSGNSVSLQGGEIFSDTTAKYNARVTVKDHFGGAVYTFPVSPTFTLFNFGANGHSIGIGGQSSNDGTLEVFMSTKFKTSKGHMISIQQIIDALGLDK